MNGFAIKVDGTGWHRVAGINEIDSATEYFMLDEGFEPLAPIASDTELLNAARSEVIRRSAVANEQVLLLQGRIDALKDAVETSEVATEEQAELPIRQNQLLEWRNYRIALGRVSAAAGWPSSPNWPSSPQVFVPT